MLRAVSAVRLASLRAPSRSLRKATLPTALAIPRVPPADRSRRLCATQPFERYSYNEDSGNNTGLVLSILALLATGSIVYAYFWLRDRERIELVEPTLEEIQGKEGVWRMKHQFHHGVIPAALSSNMYIMKVGTDTDEPSLLIYNPIQPSFEVMMKLSEIGLPIRYIVVPNKEHTRFITEFVENTPGCTVFVPPQQKSKIGSRLNSVNVPFRIEELDEHATHFPDDLSFHVIEGIPRLDEVLIYHKGQRTLFACDTMLSLTKNFVTLKNKHVVPMGIWYAERYNLLDRIALPPSIGSMVDDEEELKESLLSLCDLEPDVMLCAHGEPLQLWLTELQADEPLVDWLTEWRLKGLF